MNNIKLINFLDLPYETQMETLNWRNSASVVRFFRIGKIEEETHRKWLQSMRSEEPKTIAFVISVDDRYVGVSYFHSLDYENKVGDWGIYIYDEKLRGLGIGSFVLGKCIEYAKNQLKLNFLYLDVMDNNLSAVKLYEKFGFVLTGEKDIREDKTFLRYRLKLNG